MPKNKKDWLTDADYSSIYSRVPRVCVDVVVQSSQGVLLVFRTIEPWKNSWHLPGGRVWFGEKLFAAAIRIVKKEAGITIRPIKIIGAIEFPAEVQNGERRHTVSTVILARFVSGKLTGSADGEQVKYCTAIPKNTAPPHKKFLEEFKP